MINIQENIPLKDYTTLKIGGPAKYFVEAKTENDLKEALSWTKEKAVHYLVIAGGSNLLISDDGYDGLVIRFINEGIQEVDENLLVSVGTSLQELVDHTIARGYSGFEKLTGIPGSVGGAIYGNAGAFGQTISDNLNRIKLTDGEKDFWLNKQEIGFEYRDSGLKRHKDWIILEAEFTVVQGERDDLEKSKQECMETRKKKYPPGVACPGSFFKNLIINELPQEIQEDMPKDYYGKVPAWWFLEQVDAKGARRGNIKIMDYHANLFINEGSGKAQDFFDLAKEYKQKVKEKFGVELEPEVQLIGFKEEF